MASLTTLKTMSPYPSSSLNGSSTSKVTTTVGRFLLKDQLNRNMFNETIPETSLFVMSWCTYFLFVSFFTIYCLFMSYKLYSAILETQKGCVGKAYGYLVAAIVVVFMVVIGCLMRWLTLFTCYIALVYFLLAFDTVICILELAWIFVKSVCSPSAALCHLVCLMAMDIVEIVIMCLFYQELRIYCEGREQEAGTVCPIT